MRSTSHLVRRIRPVIVAIVAVGSLGGCQRNPSGQQTTEPAAFRAEIDKLRSDYEAAVAAGDASAMTAVLAEGAVMVQPGGPDWDALAAAASGAPFPVGARITIRPVEVVALNKEWAYEFGTSITTYTPEGGGKETQLRDTYLILLRNTGGGWKAYREVASAAPPPGGWPDD